MSRPGRWPGGMSAHGSTVVRSKSRGLAADGADVAPGRLDSAPAALLEAVARPTSLVPHDDTTATMTAQTATTRAGDSLTGWSPAR